MKILIDMQGLQTPFSARRGVGTYIEGIVRELDSLAGKHRIEYLFNAEFPEQYFDCVERLGGIVSRENSHLFAQNIIEDYRSADPSGMRLAESFVSAFVESLRPDILFSPNLQEGLHDRAVTSFAAYSGQFAQLATLHDMVPMYMEEEYLSDPLTRRWYKRKLADAAKCDRIITVSETSKLDIERFLGVDGSRIEAIPNGYDSEKYNGKRASGERAAVSEFLHHGGDYVLFFGGADKHKNIGRLVEAYASLPASLRRAYPLVLGGRDVVSATDTLETIRRCGLQHEVLLTGFIPDSLLPALIRQASLFVFPSTHEGFGLPAIEAMACGTPTIASENSAIGEVVDNPDATFDPFSVDDIAHHLRMALEDQSWRDSLRDHGVRRAAQFSWKRAACKLLEAMEEEHERRLQRSRLSFISRRVAEMLRDEDPDLVGAVAATIAESAPEPRSPRVYVDASSVALYGGNSGIQRVVRELARYLPAAFERSGAEVQVVYAVEGTTEFRALNSADEGSLIADPQCDRLVDIAPGDTLLFVDLHPGLAIRMQNRIQRMRALGVRVYHVVYDILPLLMPEKFWPDLQQEFYLWLQCVSRSDGLLCISRTVAEQTAEYLGKFGAKRRDPLMVGHFPLGSDFNASEAQRNSGGSDELKELSGGNLNFLMVGTLEPRKAHEQALLAFEQAWRGRKDWRLIIAGKQGWKMDRLAQRIREHPQFGKHLFWFDKASDETLRKLYGLADCVICASEGEGFGLPLIEAAHAGKPVIARDIPVFREVAGSGAYYFADDRDPSSIKDALQAWAAHHGAKGQPKSSKMRRHSWKQSAAAVAELLKRQEWPFEVRSAGAVDLRNPIGLSNANLKLSGFHPAEGSFAWTGARAGIEFETVEDFGSVSVRLECFSWKTMPFDVLVNGERVSSAIAETSAATHEFVLPPLAAGKNRIELLSRDAGSPDGDTRLLGLGIKQARLVAGLPIGPGQWVNVRGLNVRWLGFSGVEHDWRWTTDKLSSIEFSLAESCPSAVISIFGRAANPLRATFVLNGTVIDEQDLPTAARTIDLAPTDLKEGKNLLEIHLPKARMFSEHDRRLLGLTILEFKVGSSQPRHERASAARQLNAARQSA